MLHLFISQFDPGDKPEKSSSKIAAFDFGAPAKSEGEPKGKMSGLDELQSLSVVDEQDYKATSENKVSFLLLLLNHPPTQPNTHKKTGLPDSLASEAVEAKEHLERV